MTTIYPNTDDGFVQAKIAHGDDGMVPVNDETRGVLDHMVSIGLLTAGRPAQLLA